MVRNRTKNRAFTLVELLVVIGIIALLIAILMPALSRARKQALQASCGSNVRQVTYAALAYANDWKEKLPTRYGDGGTANLRGWAVASLGGFARLPVIGFDTTTVWDWWTYALPGYGDTYGLALGGWGFMMRDYLKNDFDIYSCPDGWFDKADFIIKWEVSQGLGTGPTSSAPGTGPGLWQWRSGYLWLPHRYVPNPYTIAGNCGAPTPSQDDPGEIARTASDLPSLLVLTDFNLFTNRPNADCSGVSAGTSSCGVGANHNASSYKQLPLISSNCAPEIFPPSIGRQENPMQMPLGMNRARIDARTVWLPWQDWEYYKFEFGWSTREWWHSY